MSTHTYEPSAVVLTVNGVKVDCISDLSFVKTYEPIGAPTPDEVRRYTASGSFTFSGTPEERRSFADRLIYAIDVNVMGRYWWKRRENVRRMMNAWQFRSVCP